MKNFKSKFIRKTKIRNLRKEKEKENV